MNAVAERILVIRLSALGDVVQALGPMAAIRRHHPGALIVALTTKPYAPLLAASPYFNGGLVLSAEGLGCARVAGPAAAPARRPLRSRLRPADFGPQRLLFPAARPRRRPDWSGIARGCSLPHINPNRKSMHVEDLRADQLRAAGIAETPPPDVSWLHADIARYGLPKPYVLMALGGSPHRPEKIWPVERFGALARQLVAQGFTPALLGTAPERPLADAVRAMCSDARSLIGRTSLAEIATLARGAAAAVGGVTGPMHLVAAAGTPSVVMFSAVSDPAQCAPRGRVAILRRDTLADLPVGEVSAALATLLKG